MTNTNIFVKIDFTGITDMRSKDMIRIDRILVTSGNVSLNSEGSLAYSMVFASECTGRPIEFFEMLFPVDAIRVKNVVTGFLNGQDLEKTLRRL